MHGWLGIAEAIGLVLVGMVIYYPVRDRLGRDVGAEDVTAPTTAYRVDIAKKVLSKVPEVTVYFWIIKVLCTTVGETFADFLNINLGLGLSVTTYVMSAALAIGLVAQFRLPRYVPGVYWLAVVLISIVGTLITDNLSDNFGVPLWISTIFFSVALGVTFSAWYASERTLSIHTIYTRKREAFYWLAILFTFALGTAAGDLLSEGYGLGYWRSGIVFALLIGALAFAYYRKANAVLTFWIAYILTRPLGASLGDLMSQKHANGGFGLGTVWTSALFLITILALVVYLSLSRTDQIEATEGEGGGTVK
jgi:uncharacterized membrane-anchored protein